MTNETISAQEQTSKPADGESVLNAGLERKHKIPEILFDGWKVFENLSEKARARTSSENVSDVLDAVVKIMRYNV